MLKVIVQTESLSHYVTNNHVTNQVQAAMGTTVFE